MQLTGIEFGLWTAVALFSSITKEFVPMLVFVIFNGSVAPGISRYGALLVKGGYPAVLTQLNDTCPSQGGRSARVCKLVRHLRREIFQEDSQ